MSVALVLESAVYLLFCLVCSVLLLWGLLSHDFVVLLTGVCCFCDWLDTDW